MENNIVSLRTYIDNRNFTGSGKTFCYLMKSVSERIEQEERKIIRINLDEIKINTNTEEIILPENLFNNDNELEKTMASFSTGISLVADRKSTVVHKRVSFALMVLGWYVNPNHDAISNDMIVLENFDYYMSKVPNWIQNFFINIFRKMDYSTSFNRYYDLNFTEKIKNNIKNAFLEYNLNEEQLKRIYSLVARETNKLIKEGALNE